MVSFAAAIFAFGTLYGVVAARYELFPYPTLRAALAEALALKKRAFELMKRSHCRIARITSFADAPATADGLLMAVGVGDDLLNFVRVIDRSGATIHEWRPNWFDIWPDDGFAPDDLEAPVAAGGPRFMALRSRPTAT